MTFEEADHRYQALRRQWEAGQVSQAQFVEEVNALRVQTNDGTWWQIRGMDGSWLRWNGAAWEQALPPQRTQPLNPQPPRSSPVGSSPPTQPLSTPPTARPQPSPPSRPAPAPPIPMPQPIPPARQPAAKRSFPVIWAAVGCFGCILLALIGGLGAAYFGFLPLPGVARSQESSPVPTLTSGFSATDPPAVPTTIPLTAAAIPTDPIASEPTLAAPQPDLSNSPRALAILNRSLIRIAAHNIGVSPLSIRDGDSYTGFEAELAQEIVSRVFGDAVRIEWVPVSAQDRFVLIQAGDIDLLIRNVSHTTSREQFGYFTDNYFLDGLRLLVKADSSIFRLADLDGQAIAMQGGTQAELNLGEQITDSGLDIDILTVSTLEEAITLLDNGDVQAVAGFWIRLENMLQGDLNYRVTGPLISIEPYGMMVPLDDPQFRDHINSALNGIILDSTWYFIFPNWFQGELPFSEEQLLGTPPLER